MSTLTLSPAFTPARPTPSLRLTRRGRLVVFALGLLVALAVAVSFAGGSLAGGERDLPATEIVVVGSDDTLWSIASAHSGDLDTREMISRIQQLNSLDGGIVVAGERLVVPVAD